MKTREGVVGAIKVTLRNYKHSDPAVPVDIFLYRCPVSTVLAYLGLMGISPGPLFVGQMLRQFLALFSLMPRSHQSLNMFKSCLVKHGLIFFFL